MKLLIATRNQGKLTEMRDILRGVDVALLGIDEVGTLPEVEEDGDTFTANAVKKARTLALAAGLWALADDSGLEVDALGGAPGVYSARYAGQPADYRANNAKLLRELAECPDRAARFRCVMALSRPDGRTDTVSGVCEGEITDACRGSEGFGYDPLFVPAGETRTFAEMPSAEKNRLSHRADALRKAVDRWFGAALGPDGVDFSVASRLRA